MMGWYGYGGWAGAAWALLMVLFWASLIGGGVWAFGRVFGRSEPPAPPLETPRQILDRRFAAGELDAEQYAEARRILDGRGVDAAPARS